MATATRCRSSSRRRWRWSFRSSPAPRSACPRSSRTAGGASWRRATPPHWPAPSTSCSRCPRTPVRRWAARGASSCCASARSRARQRGLQSSSPALPADSLARVAGPEISVVVPSHDRRLRLRWLLNALEEQTLERERWELIVATTNSELAAIVREHPVGARHITPHASGPAAQRNAGWRAARAPLILFTDDDCRPEEHWVERMLGAAARSPGAIVQGTPLAEPFEWAVNSSPHARTLNIKPPGRFAQTCNILYPHEVLERCGGFDEAFPGPAGEDLDLAERAKAMGVAYEGERDAVVYHAVEAYALPDA